MMPKEDEDLLPSLEEELQYTRRMLGAAVSELSHTKMLLDEAVDALTVVSDTTLQLTERAQLHARNILNFISGVK